MPELTYTIEHTNGPELTSWGFTVAYAEYDEEQSRHAYDWTVTRDDICLATSNVDWDSKLRSGVADKFDRPVSLAQMLGTLFSFLGAWAEAMDHADRTGQDSENADLFPAALMPLLDCFGSDDLALMGEDVEGER